MAKQTFTSLRFFLITTAYLALLFPILRAPIIGDDLINPFYIATINDDFKEALSYGFQSGTGHHFNFIGSTIGNFLNFLWLHFGALTNLPHLFFYALIKAVIFISLSLVTTLLAMKTIRHKNLEFLHFYALTCFFLAGSIQIHQIWSNDPVGNYPYSGFGSVVLGLCAIYRYILAIESSTPKNIFLAVFATFFAIFYYELNIALITCFLVIWVYREGFKLSWAQIPRFSTLILLPIIYIGVARYLTLDSVGNYSGVQVGNLLTWPKTALLGIASSFPVAAWPTSLKYIGSGVYLDVFSMFIPIIGFTYLSRLSISNLKVYFNLQKRMRPKKNLSFESHPEIVYGIVAYWLSSILILTSTVKYQSEISEVGQVYLFYASGLVAFTCAMIFFLNKSIGDLRVDRARLIVRISIFVFFLQIVVNTSLVNAAYSITAPSQRLISVYSKFSTDLERCQAWHNWAQGAWPDYYELAMSTGLDSSYRKFFEKPFCSNGTNPIL